MSTITLTKNLDSDVLHLPELKPFVGQWVEIVVRESRAPTTRLVDRETLQSELLQIYQSCRRSGWDGDHAEAIASDTYQTATKLVACLPADIPLPSVTAELDGQLNFEWYRSSHRLLTVSVSSSGVLYWAALIESEDPRGSCLLQESFPPTLRYWIGQVFA